MDADLEKLIAEAEKLGRTSPNYDAPGQLQRVMLALVKAIRESETRAKALESAALSEHDNRVNATATIAKLRAHVAALKGELRLAARGEGDGCAVLNPEASGNADETPIVQLSPAMVALFAPCRGAAPSRNGYCGGVNGFHADDCPAAREGTNGER